MKEGYFLSDWNILNKNRALKTVNNYKKVGFGAYCVKGGLYGWLIYRSLDLLDLIKLKEEVKK